MNSAWGTVLVAIATMIGGAAINLIVVGYYIGRYQSDVVMCKQEVIDLRRELAALGRRFAAHTGFANGEDYREGD